MNEGPVNQSVMIETTDCLEAIGVFRGWKNLFFAILLVCLLLVQAAFWLADLQIVPAGDGGSPKVAAAAEPNAVAKAAPATEPNQAAGRAATAAKLPARLMQKLDAGHLARAVELINGILIVTAVLFTLAMFFCLLVSLVGRLGGIRHISRAFFLAVIVLVLAIPWQTLVGSRLPGVVYTFPERLNWLAIKNESLLNTIVYYLRFSGYWLVFLLLLVVSQLRSARWTKSILHRLEII
jgi:hypothetical protein